VKICSWEQCTEPATQIARWRNEDTPPKPDTIASYCDVHVHEAMKHGAALITQEAAQEQERTP